MDKIKECLTFLLINLFMTGILKSQTPDELYKKNCYTDAIRSILNSNVQLENLNDDQLRLLGDAYRKRGLFFKELFKFQVELGNYYYLYRDTSQTATPTVYTPYFLGRYLFERGNYQQALNYFEKYQLASSSLAGVFKSRAKIWGGACHFKLGYPKKAKEVWNSVVAPNDPLLASELSYAKWCIGQNINSEVKFSDTKSVQALRLLIWHAAINFHLKDLFTAQNILFDNQQPDATMEIKDKNGKFQLRFYDPATFQILAYADFIAAMKVYSKIKKEKWLSIAYYLSGVCAFEANEYDVSMKFFEKSGDDNQYKKIYMGAINFRNQNQKLAREKWQEILNSRDEQLILNGFNIISRFDKKYPEIVMQVKKYAQNQSENMDRAFLGGGALFELAEYQEALNVLIKAYPERYNNKIEYITPTYLTLLARSKFYTGHDYSEILGHLTALIEKYPIIFSAFDIAQGLFMYDKCEGKKRVN